jgi:hypothetical protein
MRIAAVARCRESRRELLNRCLGHAHVSGTLSEKHKSLALVSGARGPNEWHALAGRLLQCLAKGGDGLLQPRRPALPLAQSSKSTAEIVLGPCPYKRRGGCGSIPARLRERR